MSTTTENLGLIKPELTDAADITAMNQNWDRLDGLTPSDIGAVPDTVVSETIFVSTVGDTLAGLRTIYDSMPSNSAKAVIIDHVVGDSLPFGGIWHTMICKTNKDYGLIMASTYNLGMSCRLVINNGEWGVWKLTSKVSGSYTGNSSETKREINIGVSASMLLINSDNAMVLVTGRGAICKPRLGTSVYGLESFKCFFKDGILTLSSKDESVNASITYWYDTL